MSIVNVLSDSLNSGNQVEMTSKGKDRSDGVENAAASFTAFLKGVIDSPADPKGQDHSETGLKSDPRQSAGFSAQNNPGEQGSSSRYTNRALLFGLQPMFQSDFPAGKEANSGNEMSSGSGLTSQQSQGGPPEITELDKYRQVSADLLETIRSSNNEVANEYSGDLCPYTKSQESAIRGRQRGSQNTNLVLQAQPGDQGKIRNNGNNSGFESLLSYCLNPKTDSHGQNSTIPGQSSHGQPEKADALKSSLKSSESGSMLGSGNLGLHLLASPIIQQLADKEAGSSESSKSSVSPNVQIATYSNPQLVSGTSLSQPQKGVSESADLEKYEKIIEDLLVVLAGVVVTSLNGTGLKSNGTPVGKVADSSPVGASGTSLNANSVGVKWHLQDIAKILQGYEKAAEEITQGSQGLPTQGKGSMETANSSVSRAEVSQDKSGKPGVTQAAPRTSSGSSEIATSNGTSPASEEVSAQSSTAAQEPRKDVAGMTRLDQYQQVIEKLLAVLEGEITDSSPKGTLGISGTVSTSGTSLSSDSVGAKELAQNSANILQSREKATGEGVLHGVQAVPTTVKASMQTAKRSVPLAEVSQGKSGNSGVTQDAPIVVSNSSETATSNGVTPASEGVSARSNMAAQLNQYRQVIEKLLAVLEGEITDLSPKGTSGISGTGSTSLSANSVGAKVLLQNPAEILQGQEKVTDEGIHSAQGIPTPVKESVQIAKSSVSWAGVSQGKSGNSGVTPDAPIVVSTSSEIATSNGASPVTKEVSAQTSRAVQEPQRDVTGTTQSAGVKDVLQNLAEILQGHEKMADEGAQGAQGISNPVKASILTANSSASLTEESRVKPDKAGVTQNIPAAASDSPETAKLNRAAQATEEVPAQSVAAMREPQKDVAGTTQLNKYQQVLDSLFTSLSTQSAGVKGVLQNLADILQGHAKVADEGVQGDQSVPTPVKASIMMTASSSASLTEASREKPDRAGVMQNVPAAASDSPETAKLNRAAQATEEVPAQSGAAMQEPQKDVAGTAQLNKYQQVLDSLFTSLGAQGVGAKDVLQNLAKILQGHEKVADEGVQGAQGIPTPVKASIMTADSSASLTEESLVKPDKAGVTQNIPAAASDSPETAKLNRAAQATEEVPAQSGAAMQEPQKDVAGTTLLNKYQQVLESLLAALGKESADSSPSGSSGTLLNAQRAQGTSTPAKESITTFKSSAPLSEVTSFVKHVPIVTSSSPELAKSNSAAQALSGQEIPKIPAEKSSTSSLRDGSINLVSEPEKGSVKSGNATAKDTPLSLANIIRKAAEGVANNQGDQSGQGQQGAKDNFSKQSRNIRRDLELDPTVVHSSAALGVISTGSAQIVAQGNTSSVPVWDQISTVLREQVVNKSQDLKQLDIQLHPEDLGKIQIDLHWENGQVHLQVQASQAATNQLLQSHLSDLRQALSNQGVNCGMIQMGLGGQGQQNSHGDNSKRTFQKSSYLNEDDDLTPAVTPPTLAQEGTYRINVTA